MRCCLVCGRPAVTARCSEHERVRLSTSARGYSWRHQKMRAGFAPQVASGTVRCAKGADCKRARDGVAALIDPGEPWDLGHTPDRRGYLGPMHAACNRDVSKKAS